MVNLTTGVLCLCLTVLGFVATLLLARNPRSPRWAGDFWIANVYAPGIITLAVFALAILIQVGFAGTLEGLRTADLWPSAVCVAVTAVLVKALRPRRTLAAYRAQRVAASPSGHPAAGDQPEPPVKPTRPRLAA